jgi:hypothetical protein
VGSKYQRQWGQSVSASVVKVEQAGDLRDCSDYSKKEGLQHFNNFDIMDNNVWSLRVEKKCKEGEPLRKIVIMGARGKDFHTFNTVYKVCIFLVDTSHSR